MILYLLVYAWRMIIKLLEENHLYEDVWDFSAASMIIDM